MKKFIDSMMAATKRYNTLDFAILKICLLAIGILFGVYWWEFFVQYVSALWIVAIVTYVIIMYKTLITYRR